MMWVGRREIVRRKLPIFVLLLESTLNRFAPARSVSAACASGKFHSAQSYLCGKLSVVLCCCCRITTVVTRVPYFTRPIYFDWCPLFFSLPRSSLSLSVSLSLSLSSIWRHLTILHRPVTPVYHVASLMWIWRHCCIHLLWNSPGFPDFSFFPFELIPVKVAFCDPILYSLSSCQYLGLQQSCASFGKFFSELYSDGWTGVMSCYLFSRCCVPIFDAPPASAPSSELQIQSLSAE